MFDGYFIFILMALLLLHIIVATLLSREVIVWVPLWRQKIKLILLIWLLPYWGLKWANRKAQLGWNEERNRSGETSPVGTGLMMIDAIFNPGARHRIEAVQEHKVKVAKKSGQKNDNDINGLSSINVCYEEKKNLNE